MEGAEGGDYGVFEGEFVNIPIGSCSRIFSASTHPDKVSFRAVEYNLILWKMKSLADIFSLMFPIGNLSCRQRDVLYREMALLSAQLIAIIKREHDTRTALTETMLDRYIISLIRAQHIYDTDAMMQYIFQASNSHTGSKMINQCEMAGALHSCVQYSVRRCPCGG